MKLALIISSLAIATAAPAAPAADGPDDRDRAVMEAALLALLKHDDFSFFQKKWTEKQDAIVLDTRTPEKTGFLQSGQIKGELSPGSTRTLPDELLAAVLQRNHVPGTDYDAKDVSFKDLKPDPRIILDDLGKRDFGYGGMKFRDIHPRARGHATLYLPGYSADGSHAVVRALIGPSAHGGAATVLLEKKAEKWTVLWVNIAWFA